MRVVWAEVEMPDALLVECALAAFAAAISSGVRHVCAVSTPARQDVDDSTRV
jgi:hypothetical protein